MNNQKPFAESCEENKLPIFNVLKRYLDDRTRLLEIGSGTGQHAIFFAQQFPHLKWQTSDRMQNHPGIILWLEEARLPNIDMPLELDVSLQWPSLEDIDAIFSANTTHIMSWPDVENLFAGIGETLMSGGIFLLYGPFNYGNEYTSESNQRFDQWLKDRDPLSGIRNFEDLNTLAAAAGLTLVEDVEMPANNRILVWKKS